jgi:hypothetical protein
MKATQQEERGLRAAGEDYTSTDIYGSWRIPNQTLNSKTSLL